MRLPWKAQSQANVFCSAAELQFIQWVNEGEREFLLYFLFWYSFNVFVWIYFEFLELKGKLILRLSCICCFYQFPKTTVECVRTPWRLRANCFGSLPLREASRPAVLWSSQGCGGHCTPTVWQEIKCWPGDWLSPDVRTKSIS